MRKFLTGALTTVLATFIGLYLAETGLSMYRAVISPGYDLTVVDGDFVTHDPLLGWRLRPNLDSRMARIIEGSVVYHSSFRTNKQGYVSDFDFTLEKPEHQFRICSMGDSFTAGLMVDRPFPAQLEALLHKNGMTHFRVYNLGITGAGLLNWNQQIKHDVGRYSCDLVILHVFYEDLDRPFTFFKQDGRNILFGSFREIPAIFDSADQPDRMAVRGAVFPGFEILVSPEGRSRFSAELDARARTSEVFSFAGFLELANVKSLLGSFFTGRIIPALIESAIEIRLGNIEGATNAERGRLYIDKEYFYERTEELLQIAEESPCEFVVSEIPSRACVLRESSLCEYNRQRIRWMAIGHGFEFHPSLEMFMAVSENLREYWAEIDPHFNQAGSDLYAQSLARYVLENHAQTDAEAD